MRVLLTSNASHVPPRGGSTRSNLIWLEHMAAAGHECRIVAAAPESDTEVKRSRLERELADQQIGTPASTAGGIPVHAVADPAQRPVVLRDQIAEFRPDWVLVSSEDLGQVLLREAHRSAPGRVVYLAHTPQFFPFGPASWNPDPQGAAVVKRSAGIVAIGSHTAAYIERHTGRAPAVIHPPIYGAGPFENFGHSGDGFVTMVNPCAVKGISIFVALARRLPHRRFAALPGWGTTSEDRAALASCSNISILASVPDIADVLRRTSVLLMPSLWFEGFGLIVMEAILHGIPVVASDSGGLVEAKRGTRFVIPVQPIERYEPVFDEHHMPKPVLPPHDVEPWAEAVKALLGDRVLWDRESAASRRAALEFVGGLRASALEEFLASLKPSPENSDLPSPDRLSPERRALLLRRLRQKL